MNIDTLLRSTPGHRRWRRMALIPALCFWSVGAWAQQPDLSGTWKRNRKMSQDATEKIVNALGTEGLQGTGARQYSTYSQSSMLQNNDRLVLRHLLLNYVSEIDTLEVEQTSSELKVFAGDDYFGLFYLDGQEHARQIEGVNVRAKAWWEEGNIRVEQIGEEGVSIEQTYSSVNNGDQLAVIFILKSKAADRPVMFRTVYDRAEE